MLQLVAVNRGALLAELLELLLEVRSAQLLLFITWVWQPRTRRATAVVATNRTCAAAEDAKPAVDPALPTTIANLGSVPQGSSKRPLEAQAQNSSLNQCSGPAASGLEKGVCSQCGRTKYKHRRSCPRTAGETVGVPPAAKKPRLVEPAGNTAAASAADSSRERNRAEAPEQGAAAVEDSTPTAVPTGSVGCLLCKNGKGKCHRRGEHGHLPAARVVSAGEACNPLCKEADPSKANATSTSIEVKVAQLSPVCLSLFVCLFVCLPVFLFVCLTICLFICLSVYLSAYLSAYLSVYLSACLSVCLVSGLC